MPASAGASAPDSAVAVLHQETRWLNAIVDGDAKIVASILSPNFTHITARGALLHRSQELDALKKETFTILRATRQSCMGLTRSCNREKPWRASDTRMYIPKRTARGWRCLHRKP
jgi:hypothetical protein